MSRTSGTTACGPPWPPIGTTPRPTTPTRPVSTSPSSRSPPRSAMAPPTSATSSPPPASCRRHLRPGSTVILESTTYPGTTEELVGPILENGSGLAAGQFHLGYSPERIDPGNRDLDAREHPEGRVRRRRRLASAAVQRFYDRIVEETVPVASPKEAELAKLLENTFRHVNIALVNELAMFASELGIDVWEAIDAASTKPFGYMRFTRARRRRPLPPDRPVVPLVAGEALDRLDLPVRRAGQRRQRAHARLRRAPPGRGDEPAGPSAQGPADPAAWPGVQEETGDARESPRPTWRSG